MSPTQSYCESGFRSVPLDRLVRPLQPVSMLSLRFSRGSVCDDHSVKQGFPCKAALVYHPDNVFLCSPSLPLSSQVTKLWHVSVVHVSVGRWNGERAGLVSLVSGVSDSLGWEGHSATVSCSFRVLCFPAYISIPSLMLSFLSTQHYLSPCKNCCTSKSVNCLHLVVIFQVYKMGTKLFELWLNE